MTPSTTSPSPAPLLDEMLEGMALSMLVFLMADLRLLSATGRVGLRWETLVLDGDRFPRTSALQVAGMVTGVAGTAGGGSGSGTEGDDRLPPQGGGLSPAQLMAMVLVEVKKTMDAKRRQNELTPPGHSRRSAAAQAESQQMTQHGLFSSDLATINNHSTEEMNPLLKAYAHMVAQDLNQTAPEVEARQSTLNLLVDPVEEVEEEEADEGCEVRREDLTDELRGSVETTSQQAQPTNTNIKTDDAKKSRGNASAWNSLNPLLRIKLSNQRRSAREEEAGAADSYRGSHRNSASFWPQRPHDILNAAATAAQQMSEGVDRRLQGLQERRKSLLMTQRERDQKRVEETADALFGMASGQAGALARDEQGSSGFLSSEELLLIMERAVESRIHDKLHFMSSFFRPGTISYLMCKSNVRVVWINDWYPLKDLTYAVAIDRDKKRVLVIFRGAITKQDWSKVIDTDQKVVDNPIREDFSGRPSKIGLYSGFHKYLFRVRKDTGTTKYDEIVNLAHQYGIDRIGEDYQLAVTGHSLGAALSTVFSFYASTDQRFTKNGPIRVISFGSPMIGGSEFADCFRHQEERGKLMYARFYNHNDLVAYLPTNFAVTKRGSLYRHVGVGVRIPMVPRPIRLPFGKTIERRWRLSVYYVGNESFWASYCRGIRRNVILNAPWFWQTRRMHTLVELLDRLMEGSSLPEATSDLHLLKQPIEAVYRDISDVDPVPLKAT